MSYFYDDYAYNIWDGVKYLEGRDRELIAQMDLRAAAEKRNGHYAQHTEPWDAEWFPDGMIVSEEEHIRRARLRYVKDTHQEPSGLEDIEWTEVQQYKDRKRKRDDNKRKLEEQAREAERLNGLIGHWKLVTVAYESHEGKVLPVKEYKRVP